MKPILVALLALIGFPLFADPATSVDAPPADTTPLGRYRCYTNDLVTQRWFREMHRNDFGALRYGKVCIRCRVHSDGTLSDLTVVVGESAGLLQTVSLNVVRDAAPFKPFGDDLIREMGQSYIDEFTFRVVRKSQLSPAAQKLEYGTPKPLPAFD